MRPLSHSSISLYQECPQKYKFKYIDKVPEKPRHYFAFGKSVHSALEYFYGVQTLPPPSLEEVLAFFDEHWDSAGYKDSMQEAEYKDDGRRILTEFHKLHLPQFKLPMFVEYGFNLKIDGVPVTGKVDRIDKLENGRIHIIDYKTGKAFEPDRVKQDAQLTMYQLAVQENLGMEVESLTFYHLPSQTPQTCGAHTEKQLDGLKKRVVSTADAITKKQFDPKPEEWKCKWCDFKPLCPVFKQPALPPAPAVSDAPLFDRGDDDLLAQLVDEYGKLQGELEKAQQRADEVRDRIVSMLKKKGYVRAFGSSFEAGLASEERWEFTDKAKVLETLKRHGLFDRVLKPSAPEVQKLMSDPALPEAARRDLEALGRRVMSPSLKVNRVAEA